MELVYGRDQEIAKWVQARAPHAERGFRDFVAVGLEDHGELIAGWVYSEWRGHSIQIALASSDPRWASRRTLYAIFAYPFLQLGCQRVWAVTGARMMDVRRFMARAGFVEEGILRCGFADDDSVMLSMLRDECRWIPRSDNHG